MTIESKITQLQHILDARLPVINRWNTVLVENKGDYFTITWKDPKAKNIHPDEVVEIPISDINEVIKRKANRLKNEVEQYK